MQVYSPTSPYSNVNIHIFCVDITKAMEDYENRLTLVNRDFSAKLGDKLNNEGTKIGTYLETKSIAYCLPRNISLKM